MNREKKRDICCFGLLILFLVVLLAANIFVGSASVSPGQTLAALLGQGKDTSKMARQIIWYIRMPRLLSAAFLGGALSVSGFLLQTFFANPIAGPFVLGISSGAKLCVALALVLSVERGTVLGSAALIAAAFLGAMLSMGFILLTAGRLKKLSLLIICGVMIGYICSAVTDIVVAFADDANIVNLHNWSMGSFSGANWGNIRTIVLVTTVSFGLAMLLSKPMGAYQLGEVYAANMGVKVKRFRAELILLSSLLSACVTAFAGPVSFVGIAVPHLVKALFGTAKPLVILPASFLGGAGFCLFCDLIARTMFAPTELGISTVTAVFGAPVVIVMLLRRRERNF